MTRIALLSDLHLSPTHGFFYRNWQRTRDVLNADPPDLVIVNGDLCIDGADRDADMEFAHLATRQLRAPVYCLPGNHDVGDEPPGQAEDQIIDPPRLARWRRTFGADRFSLRCDGWRLVGLNAQLCGSGLPDEAEQEAWLTAQLADSGGPVILFLHKPMFLDDPAETAATAATLNPAPRARLADVLAGADVHMVVSGHLHSHRDVTRGGVRYVWLPALSFTHHAAANATPMVAAMQLILREGEATLGMMDVDGLQARDLAELKGHGRYAFLRDMPPCPPALEGV